MPLEYRSEPNESGLRLVVCDTCGLQRLTEWPIENIHHKCGAAVAVLSHGPGTELAAIFRKAGAKSDLCSGMCQEWIDRMNYWGVAGCREHRGEIIKRIRTVMFKTWLTDQISAAWISTSIAREPWFKISDPVGSIVDRAIEMAEIKTQGQDDGKRVG